MTILKRDQMAEEYRDKDFAANPNGYTVAPYVNSETTSEAFACGWDAAEKEWQAQATALADLLQSLNIQAVINEQPGQQSITARINGALASFQKFKDGLK